MCYINGDMPPGSDRPEKGCSDKTPPKASGKVELPYPLYFAKERSKWGDGGVAFIDHLEDPKAKTIGRKYLITEEQFIEVVAQENNTYLEKVDLQHAKVNGYITLNEKWWYGRVVYLGEHEGAPMFTFTNNLPMGEMKINRPTTNYLSTIARGLIELGMTKEEVVDYFLDKPGIDGIFTRGSFVVFLG